MNKFVKRIILNNYSLLKSFYKNKSYLNLKKKKWKNYRQTRNVFVYKTKKKNDTRNLFIKTFFV